MRYSAERFAVLFTAVATDALWHARSTFYYKFWEEPSTSRFVGWSLVRLLPAVLSHSLILRRMRVRAGDLIEMQSGRVHYDFDQLIQKNLQAFLQDMDEHVRAAVGSIEAAIGNGQQAKTQGEAAAASCCEALLSMLEMIKSLESSLALAADEG